MSSRKCPKCGKTYPSNYPQCPYCAGQERKSSREIPVTQQIVSILRHPSSRPFVLSTLALILLAVLGMLLTRCSEPRTEGPGAPASTVQTQPAPAKPLTVSQHEMTITVGDAAELIPSGNFDTLTWTSSDESIATVDLGTVTGKAAGTAIITASNGVSAAVCEVTVQEPPKPANLFDLALNTTDFTIRPGDPTPVQLLVRIKGTRELYGGEVVWSSANEKVATVSETGEVNRVGKGTTVVTAEADGQTLECIVRISY